MGGSKVGRARLIELIDRLQTNVNAARGLLRAWIAQGGDTTTLENIDGKWEEARIKLVTVVNLS